MIQLRLWRVARLLGLANVVRVSLYRLLLTLRLHPAQLLSFTQYSAPFFHEGDKQAALPFAARNSQPVPSERWNGEHVYFGWLKIRSTAIPDWHFDPFSKIHLDSTQKWWKVKTFDTSGVDIKCVWEASRFDWMIPICQRLAAGQRSELEKLNLWLNDWAESNPNYLGANWMCAQECSVRLLHFVAGAEILVGHVDLDDGGFEFVENHLKRIAASTSYARAQQNNHIISEAVALYIGGAFLRRHSRSAGVRHQAKGLSILEKLVPALFEADGMFSQYSTNYQRMVIDLLVFAEGMRRKYGLDRFSDHFYATSQTAVSWLGSVLQGDGKSVPNLGGNDGSRVLAFDDTDYRDFSSTFAIGEGMFCSQAGENDDVFSTYAAWLGIPTEAIATSAGDDVKALTAPDPSFPKLASDDAIAFLRTPHFRFRPSNSDALHVDFWVAGLNVLRDAGSYSYAQDLGDLAEYHGGAGHNSVMFDNRETMPFVGRFLFESWLRPGPVPWAHTPKDSLVGSFVDYRGNHHARMIQIRPGELRVIDSLAGPFRAAVVNWRLLPGLWRQTEDGAEFDGFSIKVTSSSGVANVRLTTSSESLYYMKAQEVPQLQMEVYQPTELVTAIRFAR